MRPYIAARSAALAFVALALTACGSATYESPPEPEPEPAGWSEPVLTDPPAAPEPVVQAETQPGGGISWDQAAANVGTSQRVCGPLVGSGYSYDDAFLNLGLDYPSQGRFQIVVWDIGELEPIAFGSTLCTSGVISSYEGVAQIELYDPSLIEIYG